MECRKSYSAQVNATKAQVSDSPVTVGAIIAYNQGGAVGYIQMFFQPSTSVTVGTTVPDKVIPMPATGGFVLSFDDGWYVGGTGLTIACTTTRTGSTNSTTDIFMAME